MKAADEWWCFFTTLIRDVSDDTLLGSDTIGRTSVRLFLQLLTCSYVLLISGFSPNTKGTSEWPWCKVSSQEVRRPWTRRAERDMVAVETVKSSSRLCQYCISFHSFLQLLSPVHSAAYSDQPWWLSPRSAHRSSLCRLRLEGQLCTDNSCVQNNSCAKLAVLLCY